MQKVLYSVTLLLLTQCFADKLAVSQMYHFRSFVQNHYEVCFYFQKFSVDHNVVMVCGVHSILLEHSRVYVQFVVLVRIITNCL